MDQFIGNSSCHPPKESKIGKKGFSGNFQVGDKHSQPKRATWRKGRAYKKSERNQGPPRATRHPEEDNHNSGKFISGAFFQARSWLHRFT